MPDAEQLQLDVVPPVYTVHCIFLCGTVVRGDDPQANHDAMERHYAVKHQRAIDRMVGSLR